MTPSARLASPSAERNRQPMLEVLRRVLPARAPGRQPGRVLEIASGSGQHVAWFARHLPAWQWQPTDFEAASLPSIAAWCVPDAQELAQARAGGEFAIGVGAETAIGAGGAYANVLAPLRLDVCDAAWPVAGTFDAVICANMLHIAPWACCAGLMRGAARHLAADGVLVTYGPYLVDDVPTAAGNLAFDADLRRRDAAWGIRRLADVVAQAGLAGLALRERVSMPANNLMLVFERIPSDADVPRA